MDTRDLMITGALLVLLAEVTYLVAKLPRQTTGKKQFIFVDTSVLIDGRIIAVAQSGFITGTLAIPRSVIGELQFLADNADAEKRSRARHGLDIARELQEMVGVDAILFQDGTKAEEGVDNRLLNLAKKHGGAICTIDYNLNKVATVENIKVCNVNELAKNLRMAYLPGEKMMLELVQKGQDSHQGVGYLADGTMVVVEQASAQIGQTVEIEFIRSLQTAAGKMMFARKVEKQAAKPATPSRQKPVGTKPLPVQQNQHRRKQSTAQQQNTRQPNPNNQTQRSANQNQRRRPPTSKQRESALIDLVDKQQ
jgi:uncharacterized protein YacL